MTRGEREHWDLGDEPPFRPGKASCQKLILALAMCDGHITDIYSSDINRHPLGFGQGKPVAGEIRYPSMKPWSIGLLMRINLPKGMKPEFERLMGGPCLREPPRVQLNLSRQSAARKEIEEHEETRATD